MAVIRYFGLPGCGKTTTLAYHAITATRSGRYKNIYSNVNLAIHGVICVPFDVFGVYELRDCLFLIDEAMIVCGDRDHKNFGKEKLKEFMMHRHKDCDIILFSQEADGVDKKIRSITDRMFYVKKGFLTGKWISSIYHIPYDVAFPDSGDHIGDVIMGYKKPPFFARLFAKRLFRPLYYKYFDSWESDPLPPLPEEYKPYIDPKHHYPVFRPWCSKTLILLRSVDLSTSKCAVNADILLRPSPLKMMLLFLPATDRMRYFVSVQFLFLSMNVQLMLFRSM